MQKKKVHDSDKFYSYILHHGGGDKIPILVFYQDGNVEQMRDALKLEVVDLLPLPPHTDMIQNKLSSVIMKAEKLNPMVES